MARELARTSNHANTHVAAFLVRGDKVVKSTANRIRHHPNAYFACSLHAEAAAVSGMDLRGCKLYVYRFGLSDNEPRDSQPCLLCSKLLTDAGLTCVVYLKYGVVTKSHPRDLPQVGYDPIRVTRLHVERYGNSKMQLVAA